MAYQTLFRPCWNSTLMLLFSLFSSTRCPGNAYAGPSTMGGCTGTEADKQIGLWERRIKGLRRMLLGWDQARTPDPPNDIQLDVTSSTSVMLRIYESVDGSIATKCKGKHRIWGNSSNAVA